MGSGGCSYSYPIEELVKKYRTEFEKSGYQIVHYDVDVNDFVAWLCERCERLESLESIGKKDVDV